MSRNSQMKIIEEYIFKEINQSLIYEKIYKNEFFDDFLNFCYRALICSDDELKFFYDDFKKLINPHWGNLKKLSKSKYLQILFYTNLENQIDWLTETELNKIHERMKHDDGLFCSDFENKPNAGLIILNEIPLYMYKPTVMHELIHFFQWSTGKTIHQFLTVDLSEQEKTEISNLLNLNKDRINFYLSYIQNSSEMEAISNNVYNYLKQFAKKYNLRFNGMLLGQILDCFENTNFTSFNEYFHNVIDKLDPMIFLDKLKDSNYFIYLVLLGYIKQGFNSFKNHLAGYLEQEFKQNNKRYRK